MKPIDVNLEEDAEQSQRDRKALAKLAGDVDALLKNDAVVTIPLAVRRLVDGGIDPVVVAKILILGDRDGGVIYQLSARTPALWPHEQIAMDILWIAKRELQDVTAATMMVAGAVWLATQFGISRDLLSSFVTEDQPVRKYRFRHERREWGALDLCDHDGLGNRAWLVDIISKAELPKYAPLELRVKR